MKDSLASLMLRSLRAHRWLSLKEEKSTQYSVTQDIQLAEKHQMSVTVFNSSFSNLIVVRGSFPNLKHTNVSTSESRGVELVYTWLPSEYSSLLVTYGYQEPRDTELNRWLLKRPLVNGSIRYTHRWDKSSGSLELVGAGQRVDQTGTTTTGTIPGYVVANAAFSYDLSQALSLYTRVNNITDYRYQESYTYYAEGLGVLLGAEYWF